MSLLLVVFAAFGFISLLLAGYAAVSGAPWVPAFQKDVEQVLDDIKVTRGTRVIELGCGDGRLLSAAARRGAHVTGYEINPLLWVVAWLRLRRYRHARIRFGNFWRQSLKEYDVVIAFLVPRTVPRLELKAANEMRPKTRLLSYVFALPSKKPVLSRHHWFVYHY